MNRDRFTDFPSSPVSAQPITMHEYKKKIHEKKRAKNMWRCDSGASATLDFVFFFVAQNWINSLELPFYVLLLCSQTACFKEFQAQFLLKCCQKLGFDLDFLCVFFCVCL